MHEAMEFISVLSSNPGAQEAPGPRVYYVSDRPEAYELYGEVSLPEAKQIGKLIAQNAARAFPDVEFRVDSAWHSHQRGMERVAAYIERHWQEWVGAQVA